MTVVAWILLFLLTGGLAYIMATRMSAQAHKARNGDTSLSEVTKPPLRAYKYRAVELRICDNPCESALAIAGKRLLKSEAPTLPLAGCPHKKCMCAYPQYDDRRLTERRSGTYPYGMPMGGPVRRGEERRKATCDRRRGGSG